ncbi:YfhD family protein [Paenibacillus sp. MBLB4367]|uniref:YfhD family protein n=1 Tax=Paenibacillus sp. MBLB4367 TaxID=3384767 RepID=UPI00390802FD
MANNNNREQQQANRNLPTGAAEDVEFSEAFADADDREAAERAAAANNRQAGQSEQSEQ